VVTCKSPYIWEIFIAAQIFPYVIHKERKCKREVSTGKITVYDLEYHS
jgi:hypothetical protein